jgi:hypothetical protein
MDNFFRRLKYYGIGFGIGLIFVVFFFGNRGCAWYPENRVKNTIFNRILVVSDNEMVKLKELGLTKKDLILAINEGDVDFKKSKKNNHFKVYRFTCETKNGKKFNCNVTLNEDSFISEVQFGDKSAFKVKNTKEGLGSFIYFPKEKDFVFMDTTDLILCQQEAIKLVNENKLFDQSIVGIFPHDNSLTYYLLAFFNSPTCNKLIRTINPSANNPSNYIKKIPYLVPSESQLLLITSAVVEIISSIKQTGKYNNEIENSINFHIQNIYGF